MIRALLLLGWNSIFGGGAVVDRVELVDWVNPGSCFPSLSGWQVCHQHNEEKGISCNKGKGIRGKRERERAIRGLSSSTSGTKGEAVKIGYFRKQTVLEMQLKGEGFRISNITRTYFIKAPNRFRFVGWCCTKVSLTPQSAFVFQDE